MNELQKLKNEQKKIENEIKKIKDKFNRKVLQNLSIGYAPDKEQCYISLYKSNASSGFTLFFSPLSLSNLIDGLNLLKKDIDTL